MHTVPEVRPTALPTVAPSFALRSPRLLWTVLIVSTILDLALVITGPLAYLIGDGGTDAARSVARLAAVAALVAAPVLAFGLWKSLQRPLAETAEVRRRRDRIARTIARADLHTAFQPIMDVRTGAVLGFEALSRFPDAAQSPETWFADAASVGLGLDLERLALSSALASARHLPPGTYLSVNASPDALQDPDWLDLLLNGPIHPSHLVVEITEHARIDDYDGAGRARARLREHGVLVAIDDAGAGYASLRHILSLEPDIIKIDRSLAADVATDACRAELLRSLIFFARRRQIQTVAEGVDCAEQLRALRALGIGAVQGNFVGPARFAPAAVAS